MATILSLMIIIIMMMVFLIKYSGFFLYISSSILVDSDDVARIMSPVATASNSASSCVEFWFHMWGRDVETLNVYVKRESSALPSTPNTMVTGDQGNYWHRQTFTVPAGSGNYRVGKLMSKQSFRRILL